MLMVNIDSFVLVIVLVPGFTKRSLWICSPWVFKAGMVWLFMFPVDYLSIYLLTCIRCNLLFQGPQ